MRELLGLRCNEGVRTSAYLLIISLPEGQRDYDRIQAPSVVTHRLSMSLFPILGPFDRYLYS